MNARRPIRAMCEYLTPGRRPAQEDHVLVNRERGVFIVADGFGGAVSGMQASVTACESVRDFLEKEAGDLDATLPFVLRSYFSLAGNVLFNALVHANRSVLKVNKGRDVNEKGGASVLAGFIDGDLLALANVGACSAWLFRSGKMTELVMPRTFSKLCDPFSVDPVPGRDAPLMALGMAEDLEPEIVEYRIRPGDWVLLQTDGLSSEGRRELLEISRKDQAPELAAEQVKRSLESLNSMDNIAASLVIF